MIITGSAFLIRPGSFPTVREKLEAFSEVTVHANSESQTELVVTLEAEDHHGLEALCVKLTETVPEILNVTHVYVNFEDEIANIQSGETDKTSFPKPELPD
jgi:nitrate reductase NapAB chaperone NapD